MKTILITGTSSGYGQETALHFHAQGWNVIATMRTPRTDILPESDRLRVVPLDVTEPESITAALDIAGPVDVLVNNAGVPSIGVFEGTPMSKVREVFETNTFGVMATTQAVLPQFRERGSGVVINVTSSVVLGHMPLTAVYKASKMAIEGFTASLALELAPFGVQAKTVEPGACLTTNFGARALNGNSPDELVPDPYAPWAKEILDSFMGQEMLTKESDVAETIWRAVHDTTGQLRFPAGPDAVLLDQAK
ncbi:SDR family oxidoreductase [Streptomyces nodosus]|uniref:Dehydrogenase n=1 Tax=Streptomyces nodosus TaxID=40318 RepID=A0A0B5D6Q2_9ACTN|nr:SDR family oxidoreductase [Streptomyces nodosus]AJE38729.1 dehydrogenase [Streptomyces nodosus]MBB4789460.1 NAD(P)-dependent dehydrogenase (short-subunit alcohol dehydrogenase family) [Streptomyces nodosus]QEV37312.1 SDR family oxidoreductase [Streptomyces nodosus]